MLPDSRSIQTPMSRTAEAFLAQLRGAGAPSIRILGDALAICEQCHRRCPSLLACAEVRAILTDPNRQPSGWNLGGGETFTAPDSIPLLS